MPEPPGPVSDPGQEGSADDSWKPPAAAVEHLAAAYCPESVAEYEAAAHRRGHHDKAVRPGPQPTVTVQPGGGLGYCASDCDSESGLQP